MENIVQQLSRLRFRKAIISRLSLNKKTYQSTPSIYSLFSMSFHVSLLQNLEIYNNMIARVVLKLVRLYIPAPQRLSVNKPKKGSLADDSDAKCEPSPISGWLDKQFESNVIAFWNGLKEMKKTFFSYLLWYVAAPIIKPGSGEIMLNLVSWNDGKNQGQIKVIAFFFWLSHLKWINKWY